MSAKKIVDFAGLNTSEKAGFLGKNPKGFAVVSESVTEKGVVEVAYTYDGWGFDAVALIVPILDSGYCQIVKVG